MIALDGCRIERAVDGRVEIVAADARNRAFPDRVTESLGVCLKFGPEHEVRADGKKLRYPRDAICVRPPGCVWSTAATGPVGFLSIDIEPALLPAGGLRGSMSFADRTDLPDLGLVVSTLVRSAPGLWKEWLVTHLVDALVARGLVHAPGLESGAVPRCAPGHRRPNCNARRRAPIRVGARWLARQRLDGGNAIRFLRRPENRRSRGPARG